MKKPVCFISGGITGVPDYLTKFREAAKQVASLGLIPFDPAEMTRQCLQDGVQFSDDQWLDIDFAALKQCDCVYHLDGWGKSNGSMQEHFYSIAYKKPIFYQENYDIYKRMVDDGVDLYQYAKDNWNETIKTN